MLTWGYNVMPQKALGTARCQRTQTGAQDGGGTSSHASKNFIFVRVKKNCSAFLERSDSSILATIATGILGLDLPKTWPTGSVESEGGRPGEDIAGGRADCDRGVTRVALLKD